MSSPTPSKLSLSSSSFNGILVNRPPKAPNIVQLLQSPSAFINLFVLVMMMMVVVVEVGGVGVNGGGGGDADEGADFDEDC